MTKRSNNPVSLCTAVVVILTTVADPAQAAPSDKKDDASQSTRVYVEPFAAGSPEIEQAQLHLIARELFVNALARSRKFLFATTAQAKIQLVIGGKIHRTQDSSYHLRLTTAEGGATPHVAMSSGASLEKLMDNAAESISRMRRRSGYVIKRSGTRIVIARGSEDGVRVGQRYSTTDTFEEFVITKVAARTAEGEITDSGAGRAPSAPALQHTSGEVGTVDVVFVLDTTRSMQEEIDGVLHNCQRFANRLGAGGIDARLGLVTFRVGVRDVKPLTPSVEIFKSWVKPLKAGGGGTETPFAALERATDFAFRPDAVPIIVLITDEAAYDALAAAGQVLVGTKWLLPLGRVPTRRDVYGTGIAQRVMAKLRRLKAVVFPVTVFDDKGIYPYLAQQTGGIYYNLARAQDFSRLLDTIGRKIEGMFVEM